MADIKLLQYSLYDIDVATRAALAKAVAPVWEDLAPLCQIDPSRIKSELYCGATNTDCSRHLLKKLSDNAFSMMDLYCALMFLPNGHLYIIPKYGFDTTGKEPIEPIVRPHIPEETTTTYAGNVSTMKDSERKMLAQEVASRWDDVAAYCEIGAKHIRNDLPPSSSPNACSKQLFEMLSILKFPMTDLAGALLKSGYRCAIDPKYGFVHGDVPMDEVVNDECVICQEREINTTIGPCGHRCMCFECGKDIKICPICRGAVEQLLKSFNVH